MQETKEFLSLNTPSVNGVVSQNPVMIPRGLAPPYHQQAHEMNHILQCEMTRELHSQLKFLEERALFCMRVKDKTLEEAMRKNEEMEIRLRNALAEAEFWKKVSDQKTELANNLAKRLLNAKRRDVSMMRNTIAEKNVVEEAQSSTGENGDDDVDTAKTRRCKRRRL